jgi:hypothetical protein
MMAPGTVRRKFTSCYCKYGITFHLLFVLM